MHATMTWNPSLMALMYLVACRLKNDQMEKPTAQMADPIATLGCNLKYETIKSDKYKNMSWGSKNEWRVYITHTISSKLLFNFLKSGPNFGGQSYFQ
jgi:hypothetical protein